MKKNTVSPSCRARPVLALEGKTRALQNKLPRHLVKAARWHRKLQPPPLKVSLNLFGSEDMKGMKATV